MSNHSLKISGVQIGPLALVLTPIGEFGSEISSKRASISSHTSSALSQGFDQIGVGISLQIFKLDVA